MMLTRQDLWLHVSSLLVSDKNFSPCHRLDFACNTVCENSLHCLSTPSNAIQIWVVDSDWSQLNLVDSDWPR